MQAERPIDNRPSLEVLVEATTAKSVVLYLAADRWSEHSHQDLASEKYSRRARAGRRGTDLGHCGFSSSGTTSLERVARAVAIAVMSPAIADYPAEVRIEGEHVPGALIDYLVDADIAERGLP